MKNLNLFLFVILYNSLFAQTNLQDKYDVKQYIIDIQVNNNSCLIAGNVTTVAFTTTLLDTFSCDLISTLSSQTYMIVDSVFFNGVINPYFHLNNVVKIPLINPLQIGVLFEVKIYYHGNATPNTQTDWNGIALSTYSGKNLACTFSEPDGSRVWWPCKQIISDKADSVTMYITTNKLNKSGSNGLLKSIDTLANNKVRYKWQTNNSISFYLISFAVGPYNVYETYAPYHGGQDSLLLQNLLVSSSNEYQFHLKVIEKTKKLIDLFTNLICDYPFKNEKYGYSIYGNGYGAMEHQTMTTIGSLAMDTTAIVVGNYFYWYTAHELGHQWFGDNVTCSSWYDIWLGEGFSSYLEYIALQNIESQNSADNWMLEAHTQSKSQPGGSVYAGFDYRLMYKKGAAILHILRYEINNDSVFFAVLKNYQNVYSGLSASADNFKQIAESTSGIDFTNFFSQWYYGEGYPIFNLNWNQENDTLIIISNQTTSSITPLFNTHFDLKINYLSTDTLIRLYQDSNNEIFKIPFLPLVTSIEIDPKNWLIKDYNIISSVSKNKIKFHFVSYPNPFKKYVTVQYYVESPMPVEFKIFNLQGHVIETISTFANKGINIANIGADIDKGIYLLKFSVNGLIKTQKIIKD